MGIFSAGLNRWINNLTGGFFSFGKKKGTDTEKGALQAAKDTVGKVKEFTSSIKGSLILLIIVLIVVFLIVKKVLK